MFNVPVYLSQHMKKVHKAYNTKRLITWNFITETIRYSVYYVARPRKLYKACTQSICLSIIYLEFTQNQKAEETSHYAQITHNADCSRILC